MSNDLRTIRQEHKDILQNKFLISVDQDPLGKMGVRIGKVCVGSNNYLLMNINKPIESKSRSLGETNISRKWP